MVGVSEPRVRLPGERQVGRVAPVPVTFSFPSGRRNKDGGDATSVEASDLPSVVAYRTRLEQTTEAYHARSRDARVLPAGSYRTPCQTSSSRRCSIRSMRRIPTFSATRNDATFSALAYARTTSAPSTSNA